jgi:predicted flap endonuclease-1-like 5' DNA nuclease
MELNWASLVLGVLIGWGIQMALDHLFWRRRHQQTEQMALARSQEISQDLDTANSALAEANTEAARLEKALADCKLKSQASTAEVEALLADLAASQAEVARLETLAGEAVVPPAEPDNLQKIEGIGPKIASLLNASGIYTYRRLAETPAGRLQEILDSGGPNLRLADPVSWPQQAELAANESWEALQSFQDSLIGGREEDE